MGSLFPIHHQLPKNGVVTTSLNLFCFVYWQSNSFNRKYKTTQLLLLWGCCVSSNELTQSKKKMSFTRRAVKVPPNSASLEEARHRVIDFFKTVCRSIPTIIDIYNLDEVATVSELRSSAAAQIRKNSHITNTKV